MANFLRSEWVRFLRSVDEYLSEPTELVLIGGAAACLAYGISRATTDIDTPQDTADLDEAFQLARDSTGLEVPVRQIGIWGAPFHHEDRLQSVDLELRKLRILVPEKHDLALMKVIRGQENDRDAIQQMAATVQFDKDTLVDRFKNEMSHVIGDQAQIRANFLSVIEMLYGEAEADRIELELRSEH